MNGMILFFTYASQHALFCDFLFLWAIFDIYHISSTEIVAVTAGDSVGA